MARARARVPARRFLPPPRSGGKLYADFVARRGPLGNTTANYFAQAVDHSDPSAGTFQQRWYIDATNWKGDGPIFLELGGEGPCGGTGYGVAETIAAEHGALVLALEHRMYGDSMAGPLTDLNALKTLRVATVMEDIAAFIGRKLPVAAVEPGLVADVVAGEYTARPRVGRHRLERRVDRV